MVCEGNKVVEMQVMLKQVNINSETTYELVDFIFSDLTGTKTKNDNICKTKGVLVSTRRRRKNIKK